MWTGVRNVRFASPRRRRPVRTAEKMAALSQLSALCTQVRTGSVPLRRRMATAARDIQLGAVHDDERASSTPVIIIGAGAAGPALALEP